MLRYTYQWKSVVQNGGSRYNCAHCDTVTSPALTWPSDVLKNDEYGNPHTKINNAFVHSCSNCGRATFISHQENIFLPSPKQGAVLSKLPEGIAQLYEEARSCSSISAYTAAVMIARKLLMNLAVLEKAAEGLSFKGYVDYLEQNNFVPPKGKQWVDKIRKKGNEANHEIQLMTEQDCLDIMKLTEMLLRFNFDLAEDLPAT